LRSLKPGRVIQGKYGLLIAYYLIRTLMHQATQQAKLDPVRLSFIGIIRVLRNALPARGLAHLPKTELMVTRVKNQQPINTLPVTSRIAAVCQAIF
jgi:hypothetical protein